MNTSVELLHENSPQKNEEIKYLRTGLHNYPFQLSAPGCYDN